ncbi:hypothetical protein [Butyrivibrio sp. M55]|uniref:hypothetical protein n=1 Tax=Butyrivibrio sp. M55 TaxID=1855323 RepID=UPI0008DF5BC7|nr:hypothetical protein [Butyrivibrio sp. M55]SFU78786.1 hypothetical protein SAMN05216540_11018 [Butyrivibrio sp. M55]
MFTKEKLIFELPKVDYDLYFTKDSILFLAIIVSILLSICMCLWGHRSFKVIASFLIGTGLMAGGMIVLEPLIPSPTVKLFLLVLFVFLVMSLFLGLLSLIEKKRREKSEDKSGMKRIIRAIAPIVGAGVMFGVIYTGVYSDIIVDACIAAVFAVLGYIIQMCSKGDDIQFRTYDDIYYGR